MKVKLIKQSKKGAVKEKRIQEINGEKNKR